MPLPTGHDFAVKLLEGAPSIERLAHDGLPTGEGTVIVVKPRGLAWFNQLYGWQRGDLLLSHVLVALRTIARAGAVYRDATTFTVITTERPDPDALRAALMRTLDEAETLALVGSDDVIVPESVRAAPPYPRPLALDLSFLVVSARVSGAIRWAHGHIRHVPDRVRAGEGTPPSPDLCRCGPAPRTLRGLP